MAPSHSARYTKEAESSGDNHPPPRFTAAVLQAVLIRNQRTCPLMARSVKTLWDPGHLQAHTIQSEEEGNPVVSDNVTNLEDTELRRGASHKRTNTDTAWSHFYLCGIWMVPLLVSRSREQGAMVRYWSEGTECQSHRRTEFWRSAHDTRHMNVTASYTLQFATSSSDIKYCKRKMNLEPK